MAVAGAGRQGLEAGSGWGGDKKRPHPYPKRSAEGHRERSKARKDTLALSLADEPAPRDQRLRAAFAVWPVACRGPRLHPSTPTRKTRAKRERAAAADRLRLIGQDDPDHAVARRQGTTRRESCRNADLL